MNWKVAFAGTLAGALIATAVQQALAEDVVIKVWSRADRSGPLRAGNIVAAATTIPWLNWRGNLKEARAYDVVTRFDLTDGVRS